MTQLLVPKSPYIFKKESRLDEVVDWNKHCTFKSVITNSIYNCHYQITFHMGIRLPIKPRSRTEIMQKPHLKITSPNS